MTSGILRARVAGRAPRVIGGIDLHDGHRIIVKDGRNILRRELVGGIADQETCLPDRSVSHDNASRLAGQFVGGGRVERSRVVA